MSTTKTPRSLQGPRTALKRVQFELPVMEPFRLDLTVNALRRVSSNVIDVFTARGEYLHAVGNERGPLIVRVVQPRPDALRVTLDGSVQSKDETARIAQLVRHSLGIDRDLAPFYRRASRLPWLAPLTHRMQGIKPPRYRSLWEAFVNSVTFQQVSLHAATAIVRRLVTTLGTAVEHAEAPLYVFPGIDRVMAAPQAELRAMGFSAAKIATLRRAAEAIASGALTPAMIDERSTAEAARLLERVKGVGPWTASVILLRGFGRMDVFPGNDSGVARTFKLVAGERSIDIDAALAALGPYRGMLYFHLLLARLEMQGELGLSALAPVRPRKDGHSTPA